MLVKILVANLGEVACWEVRAVRKLDIKTVAAERGFIDEVIMPHTSRKRIARAFAAQEARNAMEEA